MTPIIRADHLRHVYSAGTPFEKVAIDDIDLAIPAGQFVGIIGHTGSGKSTFIQHLNGLLAPTSGTVLFDGEDIHRSKAATRDVRFQVGLVFQYPEHQLFEETVYQDIAFGPKNAKLSTEEVDARVREAARFAGVDEALFERSPLELSGGQKRRIAIAGVIAMRPKVLILDEPTAVLTDLEVEGLFDIMRSLTAEGKGIVFISHKMREVMRISDRVTVLRRGETVETLRVADTTEQELADLMIGQKFVENTYEKVTGATKDEFVLQNVSYHPEIKHGGLKDVSLTIHKGEILGVAGIDGNGQTPLAEVVTGLVKPDSGKVIGPDGTEIAVFSPETFIDAGLGNIPEDRNKMGLVGDMTIAENLVLKQTESDQFSLGHGKWLKMGEIHSYAERLREENDIRCTSVDQTARSLSGGNQQKVILARELEGHPKLLVAVYPTRGLDIGATEFIHNQIVAQRDAGCAVLLISADFDEVLKLSDRIVVLFEGQIMGTYPGANPPIKEISLAMAGK